mmetsp:Transcript_68/g.191  ORF Transcript_68/g.191 Transcript_68/m.191 type:complete len:398 (-) Transcript_68:311-1504(-)
MTRKTRKKCWCSRLAASACDPRRGRNLATTPRMTHRPAVQSTRARRTAPRTSLPTTKPVTTTRPTRGFLVRKSSSCARKAPRRLRPRLAQRGKQTATPSLRRTRSLMTTVFTGTTKTTKKLRLRRACGKPARCLVMKRKTGRRVLMRARNRRNRKWKTRMRTMTSTRLSPGTTRGARRRRKMRKSKPPQNPFPRTKQTRRRRPGWHGTKRKQPRCNRKSCAKRRSARVFRGTTSRPTATRSRTARFSRPSPRASPRFNCPSRPWSRSSRTRWNAMTTMTWTTVSAATSCRTRRRTTSLTTRRKRHPTKKQPPKPWSSLWTTTSTWTPTTWTTTWPTWTASPASSPRSRRNKRLGRSISPRKLLRRSARRKLRSRRKTTRRSENPTTRTTSAKKRRAR